MKKTSQYDIPQIFINILAAFSIVIIVFIFLFVFYKAAPVFHASGLDYLMKGGFDSQIQEAFFASGTEPALSFGMLGLIVGTLSTTLFALIIAAFLGIGSAITICEYTNPYVSRFLIAVIRLLASVPSVVFGLIGLITVVPFIEKTFVTMDMQIKYLDRFQMTGQSMLSAIIVLAFMIVPMVISLSVDAIRSVPDIYRETGYAFGMKKFRVIFKIVVPNARSGIIAGLILAAGRGIGEAIALTMVCGGLGIIPSGSLGLVNFLAPTLPLAAAIVNKSEAMGSFAVESALFSCGATLLVIGAALSICAKLIEKKMRKLAGYDK
jgi:phosphate transport system permease protein